MMWGWDKGLNRKGTGKEMWPGKHLQTGEKKSSLIPSPPGLTYSPTKQCLGENATRTHLGKVTGLVGTHS